MRRAACFAGVIGAAVSAMVVFGVLDAGSHAYTLTGYKWNVTPVLMYANVTNRDVTASAAEAALKVGMNSWKGYTTLQFAYGGRVSDTTVSVNGRNVILFRNATNGGALATTYNWSSGGYRIDSDIVFWDAAYRFFTGTNGCASGAYIEDVATHELGHTAGLSHSSVTGATMYSKSTYCTQSLRTLASDDISGLKKLYSALPLTNTAPAISISAPLTGGSYVQGTLISFAGSATDHQDGSLTSRMVWTSSRDGQIGTGGAFTKTLSVGTHTITARVTDNAGLSTSRQVSVVVTSSTRVNVALASSGATATSSSTYGTGYGAGGAINGDRRGLNWGAGGAWKDGTSGLFPDWLQVVFPAQRTINEVAVFSLQDGYRSPVAPTSTMTFRYYGLVDFTVQYWTGSVWQTVTGGVVRGNTLVWRRVTFPAVTTSRIRVLAERASDGWSRIPEVEVYQAQ